MREFFTIAIFKIKADIRMNTPPEQSERETFPALLAESDLRRSCRASVEKYFYPRSPCGERRLLRCPVCGCTLISIHALLAESDFYRNPVYHNHRKFLSTLSLRRATLPSRTALEALLFLSTLSLRRATIFSPALPTLLQYFYPRSPCGERPLIAATFNPETGISIHALLAESDSGSVPRCAWHNLFLSTLSLRRATCACRWHMTLSIFLSTLSLRRATGRTRTLCAHT